jgi:alkylated DNA repair dioxygenase AlkB
MLFTHMLPEDKTKELVNKLNSVVTYSPKFYTDEESEILFDLFLSETQWTHDEAFIYGKLITTKRKIAWFADSGFDYNYSGRSRIAQSWNPTLFAIKEKLEKDTQASYNSCLLNLYHDGTEGMAYHSDDQNHLIPDSPVAIISLGCERYFKLRETQNHSQQWKVLLEAGSLLVMSGESQKHFQHEIPKMAAAKTPRISLTWRSMK